MPGPGNAAYGVIIPSIEVTTAAKTVLQLVSATEGPPIVVPEFSLSCNGTKGFLLLELLISDNSVAGTSSAATPVLVRGVINSKNRFTAKTTYTVEPEALTAIKQWEFALPGGPFTLQCPLGRETGATTAEATKKGIALAFRCTVSEGTPKIRGYAEIEE